ncbi:MAG: SHOCT domain-containing protein [Planctomycetes bacterium]|nr:SHOCT domain-containing protein [Planctomycetota bacterium]
MIEGFSLLVGSLTWLSFAFAQKGSGDPVNDGHIDGYGHMMDSWGGGAVMWLLMLVLVVALVYLLVRGLGAGGWRTLPNETPLDILKKRYTRGEITKEQFDEIKKDL